MSSVAKDARLDEVTSMFKKAIGRTVYRRPWYEGLFDFSRRMIAIANECNTDTSDINVLQGAVWIWHQRARPEATWTDTWSAFLDAWPRIKIPPGHGFLDQFRERLAGGEKMPGVYDDPKLDRLLVLVCELSREAGEGSFYLAVRTAGEFCGWPSPMIASRRLKRLVDDGWLTVSLPATTRRATRYRLLKRP